MKVIFFIKIINSIRQDSTFEEMKLFQYIYYFFRSLYYRGFTNTFKLLSYENTYEKKLGINTHRIENLGNLTLAAEDSEQNHHYQGASYFILFSIFGNLPPEIKHLPFIDYGCGKGRALFVAEQCGFTNLIGIDIALELITQANENKEVYIKANPKSEIHFAFCDAVTYDIPPDASVFYFFNPFGPDILKKVIANIKESVTLYPRSVYCIYLNPKYKEVFEENEFELFYTKKNKRYLEGIIYSYISKTGSPQP
jgi:SAM-dependent methyltransferase